MIFCFPTSVRNFLKLTLGASLWKILSMKKNWISGSSLVQGPQCSQMAFSVDGCKTRFGICTWGWTDCSFSNAKSIASILIVSRAIFFIYSLFNSDNSKLRKRLSSLFACLCFGVLVGGGVSGGLDLFGKRNEENGHRWGRIWLLLQFNVSNCCTTLFGSWHAAKFCPVQLWAGCHCGQPVGATSKRRNVGGILSSVAQLVEA